jgi:uncharacterized membrane protein
MDEEALKALFAKALKVVVAVLLMRMVHDVTLTLNLAANLPGALAALTLLALSLSLLVEALGDVDLTKLTRPLTALAIALFVAGVALSSPGSPRYGSDAMVFTRYAVDLLLSGRNPYAHSMKPALTLYPIDYTWVTQTLEGGVVATYSYPSLSFLIYAPAIALGLTDVGLMMLSFFILATALLVLETPREYRLLPVVVLLLDLSIPALSYAGTHDSVWLLFLLLSMKFFNPSSTRELGLSAVMLGLSMAVKQTPWLTLPFIALWLLREAGWRRAAGYAALASASFLAPNLPFILWSPLDWVNGVLTPLAQPLIPVGVGLVSLVYGGYMHLPRLFFAAATAIAAAAMLALYWLNFDRLKLLAWIAPPFILFFAWRSLYSYFVFFIPVAYYAVLLKVKGRV